MVEFLILYPQFANAAIVRVAWGWAGFIGIDGVHAKMYAVGCCSC